MARTTKEEAQKTKEKIVDTAVDLFYERGVSDTSLEQIAEAAGLTRGAIYWHFKNKLDLVAAIHDDMHIAILETMAKELENPAKTPLARIRAATSEFMRWLYGNERCLKVLNIFITKCDYSGEMAGFIAQQNEKKHSCLAQFAEQFEKAKQQGEVPGDRPGDFLAFTLFAFISGLMAEGLRFGRTDQIRADLDRHLDILFSGLAANGT